MRGQTERTLVFRQSSDEGDVVLTGILRSLETEFQSGTKTGERSVCPQVSPGRDPNTFLIHADNHANNHTASEGCIVLDPRSRQKLLHCGGGTLEVIP